MSRKRRIFVLMLFSTASMVIIYVGIHWITDYFQSPGDKRTTTDLIRLLVSLPFLALLTIYLLRVALAQLIRWAFTHGKPKLARLFQRIAPGLSKRILGSMLGTSIAFSAAAAAYAGEPLTTSLAQAPAENPIQEIASYPGSQQPSVPSPQWFPESVSVPLSPLVSPGARHPGQRAVQTTEVVVAEGQNLWSIAAEHLGAQATVEEISAYWPKIYRHNEKSIGADPDLLRIGTVLELPPAS
ncbi:LysM peptidoglycan-binding domain-containing protein [Glutamicibacter sp.]|uniref:LysM peptidoglycan-binding domain-containing protein n=1 Tax=Glutamicibacter sp. TaxID=1931995 RepID=UPI003D6BE934